MIRKAAFILIILIILAGSFLWYFSRNTADPNREIEWGVTYSPYFAKKFGLDFKKAYEDILDDLKIRKLRLAAYWTEVESEKNNFDFSGLDWQVQEAEKRNAKVILAIGRKLPRWPECHEPEWIKNDCAEKDCVNGTDREFLKKELLAYIKEVVNHYKTNRAVWTWQIENEPFLNFGECAKLDEKFLDEEIALVRELDNRPIIITDSGELSLWVKAADKSDIFGTTMYRYVWHNWLGSYKYPITPAFFRIKERIAKWFVGEEKPFIVVELQGEPWSQKQIYELAINEQISALDFEKFKGNIEFAKQTGFSEYYLWGVEWWWFLKQNNHPEYWDFIKLLTAEN